MDILKRIDSTYLALVKGAIASTPPDLHKMPATDLRNFRNAPREIPPAPKNISITDTIVAAKGRDIPVRVYRKRDQSDASQPLIVYYHGGGFVIGSLDTHQASCLRLCSDTGWTVVSVGYRLAPEHPFPAAPEDCYAALCWVAEKAVDLGADTSRIALVGESAGGNLAAATALMARDRNGPEIAFQLLFYPVTDCDFSTPSYLDFAAAPLLPARMMRAYWRHFLGGDETTENAYAAPLRALSLVNLPRAAIATAEVDVLRSEAEAYGSRLKSYDVPITEYRANGLIHGFMKHVNIHPEANRIYSAARDDMVTALTN
ncbi:MAG: alpha/beta hydrolase [Proteobacteria bacterium]|nr:alpha/beta hydrolase [Pseudomonadota bacterium]